MTVIALQAPMAPLSPRTEAVTPSAYALPPVQTVPAVPNAGVQLQMSDQRPQGNPPPPQPAALPERAQPRPIDPFPKMRFADPLPDLPELEAPAPSNPYQAALSIVRGGEGSRS